MADVFDQVFVGLKRWAVDLFPVGLQPIVSPILTVVSIVTVFGLLFGLTTVLERKGIARMQNRLGPNRVGPYGLLQFVADGIKALIKEDIVPSTADRLVHGLAPVLMLVPVLLTYAVIPFGREMVALDLETGVLFFFAAGTLTELVVFMAGWAGGNKYGLLGAMRAIAQMISYELPFILAALAVVIGVGSLSTVTIVEAQGPLLGGWLARWHVFTPWGLVGFLLFTIAALAEANRSPFDLPEGESEIVAGYFVEYSGFKFALFFMAEYLGMFASSGMAVTLFLGGWQAPVSFLAWVPSWVWFFLKLFALVALVIWIRGTMPRLRQDQLMAFAWKFMLPLTLINLVAAVLWHYLGGGLIGWLVCGSLLMAGYAGLGRLLQGRRRIGPRTYRYAG